MNAGHILLENCPYNLILSDFDRLLCYDNISFKKKTALNRQSVYVVKGFLVGHLATAARAVVKSGHASNTAISVKRRETVFRHALPLETTKSGIL